MALHAGNIGTCGGGALRTTGTVGEAGKSCGSMVLLCCCCCCGHGGSLAVLSAAVAAAVTAGWCSAALKSNKNAHLRIQLSFSFSFMNKHITSTDQ